MKPIYNLPSSLIDKVHKAKSELEVRGIRPGWIKLSPNAHEVLLQELNRRDGKRHTKIFEIMGLKIDIDAECPQDGAYMGGDDDFHDKR